MYKYQLGDKVKFDGEDELGIIVELTDQNRVQETNETNPQLWYGVKFSDGRILYDNQFSIEDGQ